MARLERPGYDPLAEFLSFPVNTQLYARLWLRDRTIHPAAHWVIRDRLEGWAQRVEAAPAEIRTALDREAAASAGAPRPALTMPLPSSAEPTGAQSAPPWCPSTPQISECAQAVEATREIHSSPPRAYHRRAKPQGSGRWALKRRLVSPVLAAG
jgi:hypothetical protein